MTKGGHREGSGRKAFCEDAVSVHWRVSENAKAWLKAKAAEEGVSIGAVLDGLIRENESLKCGLKVAGNALSMPEVSAAIQNKISAKISDAVMKQDPLEQCMDRMSWEITKLHQCYECRLPARINGEIVRILNFNVQADNTRPNAYPEYRLSFETVPVYYKDKDVIDIDINILKSVRTNI